MDGVTRRGLLVLALLPVFVISVTGAYAGLERVGPINLDPTVGSYPAWYQDTTGLTLEFCAPLNQAEVDGGWCLLLPGDVSAPEHFPDNFFDEHFWFAADTGLSLATGGRALLVLAVEGAFAANVEPGGQITFSRIRMRLDPAPVTGTYRFIHPYGEESISAVAGGRIFFTDDVGINCPPGGPFDCALQSRLGPFLLPSVTPGGPELPAIPGPVPGKLYIADPARSGPVTGSALPDFIDSTGASRNHNIFRIEGPPGSNIGGPGVDFVETVNFTLMGRVYAGTIPGKVTVERASYTNTAITRKVDVFATAFATTQGRLPASPPPAPVMPVIAFYNAACGVNLDGTLTAPAGLTDVQMFNTGKIFWGQIPQLPSAPPAVCVVDETARNANGQVVPTFIQKSVTDEVTITEALWDPANGGTLSVKAISSDQVAPAALTLAGFGLTPATPLASGQVLVTPVFVPPAKVFVLSSAGGLNEFQVTTGVGPATGGNIPVAVNDESTIVEDSGTTTINVLANDTLNASPIDPAVAVVTITGAARLGTAVVVTDPASLDYNKILYTPNLNANGIEGIGYTVTVNGIPSSQAYVTIPITPVNDPPVAVNDSASTVVNYATTINVLVNDTDVDGQADLANAVNVTPSAGLTVTSVTGGLVTFTATAAGTYTFTYQAQDNGGGQGIGFSELSGNTATVTVNVAASETITVAGSQFVAKALRWRANGTDNLPAGQTLTFAYADGIFRVAGSCPATSNAAGTVVGTAVVDAVGAWVLDGIVNGTGVLNPTNTAGNSSGFWCTPPRRLNITSPLGGAASSAFTIK